MQQFTNSHWKKDESIYGNYVCSKCYHKPHECTCKYFPPISLTLIDEGIQDSIRILNEKGYKTLYSCESHSNNDNMYINMANKLDGKIEPPDGFKFSDGRFTVEHLYKGKHTKESFENEKSECLSNLAEWCEKLPNKR